MAALLGNDDVHISSIERVLKTGRDALFGVLYLAAKDTKSSRSTQIVLQVINFMQMLVFPLSTILRDDVAPDAPAQTGIREIADVFAILNAGSLDRFVGFDWYLVLFVVAITWVTFYVGMIVDVGVRYVQNATQRPWILKTLRNVALLSSTILFVPLQGLLLRWLNCQGLRLVDNSCFGGIHIIVTLPVLVVSPMFVALSLFISSVFLTRDPLSSQLSARVHGRAEAAMLMAKVMLVLIFSVLQRFLPPIILLLLLLPTGIAWVGLFITQQPYMQPIMNDLRTALGAAFLWTTIVVGIAMAAGSLDVGPLTIAGLPLSAGVGWFASMTYRSQVVRTPLHELSTADAIDMWARERVQLCASVQADRRWMALFRSRRGHSHGSGGKSRHRSASSSAVGGAGSGVRSSMLGGGGAGRSGLSASAAGASGMMASGVDSSTVMGLQGFGQGRGGAGSTFVGGALDSYNMFARGGLASDTAGSLVRAGGAADIRAVAARLISQAEMGYRMAMDRHPTSGLAQVAAATFFQRWHSSRFLELQALSEARRVAGTSLDVRFFVYQRSRALREEKNTQSGDVTDGMSPIDRVLYEQHWKDAVDAELSCYKAQVKVWDILMGPSPDLSELQTLGNTLRRGLSLAQKHYRAMLRLNGESVKVLKAYATFLSKLMNDESKAAEFFNKVTTLEKANSRHKTRVLEHLVWGAEAPDVHFEHEQAAVLTVSAEERFLGEIQSVNSVACRVFGRPRLDMLGRNIAITMPPPVCHVHTKYLQKFVRTGRGHFISSTRYTLAVNANGHLMPVRSTFHEAPPDESDARPRLLAMIEPMETEEEYVIFSGAEKEFRILAASSGTHLAYGTSSELLSTKRISILRFFPEVDPVHAPKYVGAATISMPPGGLTAGGPGEGGGITTTTATHDIPLEGHGGFRDSSARGRRRARSSVSSAGGDSTASDSYHHGGGSSTAGSHGDLASGRHGSHPVRSPRHALGGGSVAVNVSAPAAAPLGLLGGGGSPGEGGGTLAQPSHSGDSMDLGHHPSRDISGVSSTGGAVLDESGDVPGVQFSSDAQVGAEGGGDSTTTPLRRPLTGRAGGRSGSDMPEWTPGGTAALGRGTGGRAATSLLDAVGFKLTPTTHCQDGNSVVQATVQEVRSPMTPLFYVLSWRPHGMQGGGGDTGALAGGVMTSMGEAGRATFLTHDAAQLNAYRRTSIQAAKWNALASGSGAGGAGDGHGSFVPMSQRLAPGDVPPGLLAPGAAQGGLPAGPVPSSARGVVFGGAEGGGSEAGGPPASGRGLRFAAPDSGRAASGRAGSGSAGVRFGEPSKGGPRSPGKHATFAGLDGAGGSGRHSSGRSAGQSSTDSMPAGVPHHSTQTWGFVDTAATPAPTTAPAQPVPHHPPISTVPEEGEGSEGGGSDGVSAARGDSHDRSGTPLGAAGGGSSTQGSTELGGAGGGGADDDAASVDSVGNRRPTPSPTFASRASIATEAAGVAVLPGGEEGVGAPFDVQQLLAAADEVAAATPGSVAGSGSTGRGSSDGGGSGRSGGSGASASPPDAVGLAEDSGDAFDRLVRGREEDARKAKAARRVSIADSTGAADSDAEEEGGDQLGDLPGGLALRTTTRASGGKRGGPLGLRTQSAMDGTVNTATTASSGGGDSGAPSSQLIRRIIQTYDVLRDPAVARMRLTMFVLLFLLVVGGIGVLNVMGPLQNSIERHTRTVFDAGERTALVRTGFIQLINLLVAGLGDGLGDAADTYESRVPTYKAQLSVMEQQISSVSQRLVQDANFIEGEQLQADVTPSVIVVDETQTVRTFNPQQASLFITAVMRDMLQQEVLGFDDPSASAYGLSDIVGFEDLGQIVVGFNDTTTLKKRTAAQYLVNFRTWTIMGFAILFLLLFISIALVLFWSISELSQRRRRVLLLFLTVPTQAVKALRNRASRKLISFMASLRSGDSAEGVDYSRGRGDMGGLSTLVQEGPAPSPSPPHRQDTPTASPTAQPVTRAVSFASTGSGADAEVSDISATHEPSAGGSSATGSATPSQGLRTLQMGVMSAAARFKTSANLQRMSEDQLSDFAAAAASRVHTRRGLSPTTPTAGGDDSSGEVRPHEESGAFIAGSLISMTGPLLLVAAWLLTMFIDQSIMINAIQVATQRVYMTQQIGAFASTVIVGQSWLIGDALELHRLAGPLARDSVYRPGLWDAERSLAWRTQALLHGTEEPVVEGGVALPPLEEGSLAFQLFAQDGCIVQDDVFFAPDCRSVEEGVMNQGLGAALDRLIDMSVQVRTRFPYGDPRNVTAVFQDSDILNLAARSLELNLPYVRGGVRVLTEEFVEDASTIMTATRNRQQVLTISIVSALVLYVLFRYLVQINRLGETVVSATTLLIAFPDAVVKAIPTVQSAVKEIASQSAVVLSQGDAAVHIDGGSGGGSGGATPMYGTGADPFMNDGGGGAGATPTMARQGSSGTGPKTVAVA